MKTLAIILTILAFNTVHAKTPCSVEAGEKESSSCMLEQAQVDAALAKYKPQGNNDIRLFCGHNEGKAEACRAVVRYVDKSSGDLTEEIFEEWFISSVSGTRWRGVFVKGQNGYNLY